MRTAAKQTILFASGGIIYYFLEILWRGKSHWTMILVGGLCFTACGLLNELFSWETSIWLQMLTCSVIITLIEFASGCILNLLLKMNIWDYSNMPMNLFGQICVPFSALWFAVSFIAIILDDYMRYWLFGEERPHYIWR